MSTRKKQSLVLEIIESVEERAGVMQPRCRRVRVAQRLRLGQGAPA